MKNKEIIRIINEEISNFDFLGNEGYLKEQESLDLLQNEDFQKQFICDSLISSNKIKTNVIESNIGGDWEKLDNASKLILDYFISVEYKYDINKEAAVFDLEFTGNISINVGSHFELATYTIPPSSEAWFDAFNWSDIETKLYTKDGDVINFIAFQKAPPRIQTIFIRNYVDNYIETFTGMKIRTKEMNYNSQNSPYC